MMRKVLAALAAVAASATGLMAQAGGATVNGRVQSAQPTTWVVPDCGLTKGNFLIGSSATYLKTGLEASVPETKLRLFTNARDRAIEGIEKGQAGSSAAWYYLGRAYLQLGNLAGADTALTRAQTLTPSCAKDIQLLRRNTWVALVNAGNVFMKDKNNDSASVLFREANEIYRSEPNSYSSLAVLFNAAGQTDSAIAYFKQAVLAAGSDPKSAETRDQSQYNMAALLSNSGRWPEAVAAWQQYLQWKPDDIDGKKGYARALRSDGQPDAAAEIERELISGSGADVPIADLMAAGVNFFNDKNYPEAAATFARVVKREPWNRDALFNMGNAYLGSQNGDGVVTAGLALYAIEPMNENSVKLLAQGYQLKKDQKMIVKYFTEVEAMAFNLDVQQLQLQSGGAKLVGTATGRAAKTIDTKPIAPHPVTLVFEFLDEKMGVVATSERTVKALGVGETAAVEAEGLGAGIVGWRYSVKK
jgi:tetratricopeptide (TPR) repeat protein